MPYLTISHSGESLYKEKGSKFLGFAVHCRDEATIKALLEAHRREHPGACHVCYAFKLGYDGKKYRASDDGEPNNSAGQPILAQINAFGVTQVLVAVVRYYGGTKLGVGGLINAYRTAAKLALENAEILERDIMAAYAVTCSYEQLPLIMKEIKMKKIDIVKQQLDLSCALEVSLKIEESTDWEVFLSAHELDFEKIE
jgi:uncharacterized YigZ family protein